METTLTQSSSYANFMQAINTDTTARVYKQALNAFMRYSKIDNPDVLLDGNNILLEDRIRGYIQFEKARKVSSASIQTHIAALKLFYEMNREPLAWKLIGRTIGRTKKLKDRAYLHNEIKMLADNATIRDKAVILLMASSGIRVGALEHLDISHLKAIDELGIYMITVYEGHGEEYYTFCTPEARKAIDDYLAFRKRHGENIVPSSPLFRKEFDYSDEEALVLRTNSNLLKVSINHLAGKLGVRNVKHLELGQVAGRIRHPVKAVHGFRKFFDTECTKAGISPLYVELLMGHDTKLKESYFKPTETDLLYGNDRMHGYVDAIDYLTINEENRLKRKNTELQKQTEVLPEIQKAMLEMRKELDDYKRDRP